MFHLEADNAIRTCGRMTGYESQYFDRVGAGGSEHQNQQRCWQDGSQDLTAVCGGR